MSPTSRLKHFASCVPKEPKENPDKSTTAVRFSILALPLLLCTTCRQYVRKDYAHLLSMLLDRPSSKARMRGTRPVPAGHSSASWRFHA
eukprot:scaffold4470_cov255-Prasinococcus_capsulatus_cf.AAC.4